MAILIFLNICHQFYPYHYALEILSLNFGAFPNQISTKAKVIVCQIDLSKLFQID